MRCKKLNNDNYRWTKRIKTKLLTHQTPGARSNVFRDKGKPPNTKRRRMRESILRQECFQWNLERVLISMLWYQIISRPTIWMWANVGIVCLFWPILLKHRLNQVFEQIFPRTMLSELSCEDWRYVHTIFDRVFRNWASFVGKSASRGLFDCRQGVCDPLCGKCENVGVGTWVIFFCLWLCS